MSCETTEQADAWRECIEHIAAVSEAMAFQAGVGGMETAGSIVSYLARNPDKIAEFKAGGSILDWPFGWHVQGCLSWHGQNGKIISPEFARRDQIIRQLKRGEHTPKAPRND